MRFFGLLFLMVAGCGPLVAPSEDSGSDATTDAGSSTEAPPPPPPSTSTSTSTTTSSPPATTTDDATIGDPDDDSTGSVFLIVPDGGTSCLCCDVFAQDCPDGEKCMPWANDGSDVWNGTRCSDIASEPAGLGEPCTVTGSAASGIDDCELGLVCWDVDPDTLQGTCTAMCTGNEASPECPAGTECLVSNNGVLILCLPACDPLALDACPAGDACIPSEETFVCAPSADPMETGVPCEPAWVPGACGPGSVCAYLGTVPPCDGELPGCCAATCDLSQPDPCGALGLTCTSWWGNDPVPPGLEDVGFCALP